MMMDMMMPGMNQQSGMTSMGGMQGDQMAGTMQGMSTSTSRFIPLDGPSNTSGLPLTKDQGLNRASEFIASLNNPDLAVGILKEYDSYFYVALQEKSTGVYAFDILVDKMTGSVYAEPGPNMVWNTKYSFVSPSPMPMTQNQLGMQSSVGMGQIGSMGTGMTQGSGDPAMNNMQTMMQQIAQNQKMIQKMMEMIKQSDQDSSQNTSPNQGMNGMDDMQGMNGMVPQASSKNPMVPGLGKIQSSPLASTIMFVTSQDAILIGQQFLDTHFPGQTIGKIRMYYGFYTLDVSLNGESVSSLAVNGYTGQVWYKTWHSEFTQTIGN